MKANEFVKLFDIDIARNLVINAPESTRVAMKDWPNNMYFALEENGRWCRYSHASQTWVRFYARCDPTNMGVYIYDLIQLIESHEIVKKLSGLEKAKEVISGTENARFFGCDIGTAKYWVSMSNEYHICEYFFPNMSQQFAVNLGRLRKAIADVESCQPEQDIEQLIDEFRACGESGWSKYDDPVGEWLKEDRANEH